MSTRPIVAIDVVVVVVDVAVVVVGVVVIMAKCVYLSVDRYWTIIIQILLYIV